MTYLRMFFLTMVISILAGLAQADGGWVLWMKIDNDPSRTTDYLKWEVQNASPDYQECLQLADAETTRLFDSFTEQLANKTHAELKKRKHSITITNPGRHVSQRIDFLCLPSSMDPRP